MKRELWLGLLLVLILSAACGFFARVAPKLSAKSDDLAWLRTSFNLNRQQVEQVELLHSAYMPRCMEMCARIREANGHVRELIEQGPENKADLEVALQEAEKVQAECRRSMVAHVYAVSAVMPRDEAQRFLREMAPHLAETPVPGANGISKPSHP